jgi:hypothetical protein
MRSVNLNEIGPFPLWKVPIETGEERREKSVKKQFLSERSELTVSGFFPSTAADPEGAVSFGVSFLGPFLDKQKGTNVEELVESIEKSDYIKPDNIL